MGSQHLVKSDTPRARTAVEVGLQKPIDENRAAAFALLLSLHKYSRWVSSLRSSRPASAAAAGKELQRVHEMVAYFPDLARQVSNVLALHLELVDCVAGDGQNPVQASELLEVVTRQGETVARLSASCEKLTAQTCRT